MVCFDSATAKVIVTASIWSLKGGIIRLTIASIGSNWLLVTLCCAWKHWLSPYSDGKRSVYLQMISLSRTSSLIVYITNDWFKKNFKLKKNRLSFLGCFFERNVPIRVWLIVLHHLSSFNLSNLENLENFMKRSSDIALSKEAAWKLLPPEQKPESLEKAEWMIRRKFEL